MRKASRGHRDRDEDESKKINPVLNHKKVQRGAVNIAPSHHNNPTIDRTEHNIRKVVVKPGNNKAVRLPRGLADVAPKYQNKSGDHATILLLPQ